MLFLIDYDRRRGKIVSLHRFYDSQRRHAEEMRLEFELAQNRTGQMREIVLLEAVTEDALRKSHRRYFEELSELASTPTNVDTRGNGDVTR